MTATTTTRKDWADAYSLAMGNAAAHRATGHRLVASRKTAGIALSSMVTAEVAHVGFADRLVRMAEATPAVRLTFRSGPTSEMRRRLVGAATWAQRDAEACPTYALTGSMATGKRHGTETPSVANIDDHADVLESEYWSACDHEEAREAVLAAAAELPETARDTILRLALDLGVPDGITPECWRRRVSDARQAFREAWAERHGD